MATDLKFIFLFFLLLALFSCNNKYFDTSDNKGKDLSFIFFKVEYDIKNTYVSDSVFVSNKNKIILYKKYYPNGKLRGISYFMNNKRYGQWIMFNENEEIIYEEFFFNDNSIKIIDHESKNK